MIAQLGNRYINTDQVRSIKPTTRAVVKEGLTYLEVGCTVVFLDGAELHVVFDDGYDGVEISGLFLANKCIRTDLGIK